MILPAHMSIRAPYTVKKIIKILFKKSSVQDRWLDGKGSEGDLILATPVFYYKKKKNSIYFH